MVHDGWRVVWQTAQTARDQQVQQATNEANWRDVLALTSGLSRTRLGHRPQQQGLPETCTLRWQAVTHGGNNTHANALEAHVSTQTAPAHKQVIQRPGANHDSQPSSSTGARACPALTPTHNKVMQLTSTVWATERWLCKLPSCRNAQASTHMQHASICCCCIHKHCVQREQHNATFSRRHTTHGPLHAQQQEL